MSATAREDASVPRGSTEAQPSAGETPSWHLFEVFGVEIEYMLVDASSFAVLPQVDRLIQKVAGEITAEVELGPISWSNELVSHVLELKTNGPAADLALLPEQFHHSILEANRLAAGLGGRILPGAMHPWMDPRYETVLWPHEYSPVYHAYDRIFGCQGHGWSNLQSMHLNLPFSGDEEFARLHSAIRLLLPLLPAVAAGSPVADRRVQAFRDFRLHTYRHNSDRVWNIVGDVVPEAVFSRAEYQQVIMQPMFEAIAPLDPEGVLRGEFLNARGAIPHFGRGSIEIRVIDAQECPMADVAIAAFAAAVLRLLVDQELSDFEQQKTIGTKALARIFDVTVREAENTPIEDPAFLSAIGYRLPFGSSKVKAGDLLAFLLERCRGRYSLPGLLADPLRRIVERGSLATRQLNWLGGSGLPGREVQGERLRELCNEMADCLLGNRQLGV